MVFGRIVDLRNNTTSNILVRDIGVVIPGNPNNETPNIFRVTDYVTADKLDNSTDLRGYIQSGNILVNGENGHGDGTLYTNLSIVQSLDDISITKLSCSSDIGEELMCIINLNPHRSSYDVSKVILRTFDIEDVGKTKAELAQKILDTMV